MSPKSKKRPKAACRPTHDDEPAVIRHLREFHDELDAAPGGGTLPRRAAPPRRRLVAVCARPDRPDASRAHRRSVLRDRACGARAAGRGRAFASRPAGRIERAPGRQVLRQLQRVRIDAGRVGDRPGVPDRADRTPRRSARAPRRDRRHDVRFGRQDRYVRRERRPGQLAAAASAAAWRDVSPGLLPRGRVPGNPRRHPQPVRRYRCGGSAPGRRRVCDEPAAPWRYDGRDAGLRRLQARYAARGVCEEGGRRGVAGGGKRADEGRARSRAHRVHVPERRARSSLCARSGSPRTIGSSASFPSD